MKEKTKSYVLSVDLDDPSTSTGITNVVKKILPYIPVISEDGHVRKKTCLMGQFLLNTALLCRLYVVCHFSTTLKP